MRVSTHQETGTVGRPTIARARSRRWPSGAAVDSFFFVFVGLASIWLAVLLASESLGLGWGLLWFAVVFWLLVAYLVLPRLHRILTWIYVPDYFIGRTRTSDGLLGDPVNLAVNGSERQLHAALAAAGWTRADEITLRSTWRIVAATLFRRSYDEAPVSPLFLFGRAQDFAYQQEVEDNPAKRHHVRFWRCPDGWMLPGGYRVDWLAAGTFDRAVGLSLFTLQITHKIDEDTDRERDHIVAGLCSAEPAARVRLIRDFSSGYHSRNGGGDTILALELGLVIFVYLGRNWARLVAMSFATLSIGAGFIDYLFNGVAITFRTSLLSLTLDILVLLALSSTSARGYASRASATALRSD